MSWKKRVKRMSRRVADVMGCGIRDRILVSSVFLTFRKISVDRFFV